MFPYLARFIPLALVAIQPPSVENSMESGSIPIFMPSSRKASFKAIPVIPASTIATPSSFFTHWTFDKPFMSKAMKGLGSTSIEGHTRADVTLVRPPTGITAKFSSLATCRSFKTSSSFSGLMTASGMRSNSPARKRQISARPWPVPARIRDAASMCTRDSGKIVDNLLMLSAGAGNSGNDRSGSVSRTPIFIASSPSKNDHNPCNGLFASAPYLLEVICIAGRPSTH
mmetsp:Transcript_122608/g.192381  ORF Transcript_122608/g.192381 Transcript_122608/m.192381 type:complete len:228 (-) Transcript_122608:3088-3771(-)